MEKQVIYIVISYTDTWPGRLIIARAALKFWNRYKGDTFSHVSISMDRSLSCMYSFARRTLNNPFNAGLIKEDIHAGMFAKKADVSRMAVIELPVTQVQYQNIEQTLQLCWNNRDQLKFNFLGLIAQLISGRGVARKNHFFCSQWVSALLNSCGIDLFHKKTYHVRPFDFYVALNDKIIYEGLAREYPSPQHTVTT